MAPHNEDWSTKTGRRHFHDLIMLPQSFPRMLWGLAHRVVSSQRTVSVPTNRVNGASRHTWSSFQHNESIPMIVMSVPPPHSRPLLSNSPGQRHVAHCPQGQPNAPREARGSSTPEEPWKVSSPCPQAGMNHSSCNLGLLAPPLLQVTRI